MLRVTALNKVLRKRSRFFLGKLSKECELRHYAIFYFNVNEEVSKHFYLLVSHSNPAGLSSFFAMTNSISIPHTFNFKSKPRSQE